MILTAILEKNALRFGNSPALTMKMGYRTITLTYQQVIIYAQKTALLLESNELHKGDIVLVCAPNSPYWICLFWGCLLQGIIVVPLNIQSTETMIQKIVKQTQAKLLFEGLHTKKNFDNIKTFQLDILPELIEPYNQANFISTPLFENDVVEIMYTSGTTGDPKGVVLTHQNFYTNLMSVASIFPVTSKHERILSILPLSHIYEQTIGFLLPFNAGAHIIYTHSYAAIRTLLKEYCVTKFLAVPEFLKAFMSKIEAQIEQQGKKEWFDFLLKISLAIKSKTLSRIIFKRLLTSFGGCLNTIASGGAPLDPLLEKKWEALGITIMQGYGLTETSPVISSNTYQAHRTGSVGKIIPGLTAKIDLDGQILVKGPSVFRGYFKNEALTHEVFTAEGWFKTGDMGFIDDGFLFLKGRKKYMLKGAGAQNVYPEDIEAELNKIAGVKDSCVIGLEKAGGVVDIHAVILFNEGQHDGEKIIQQANGELASYQQINSWSWWPEPDFPRSATAKVKKNEVISFIQAQGSKTAVRTQFITPLIKILATLTHVPAEEINSQTKLIHQLHLDSLLRIELILRIEEDYGISIDETKITTQTTVAELEALIKNPPLQLSEKKMSNWPKSWWANCLRVIGQTTLFAISRIFVEWEVVGVDIVKNLKMPVIFMPNHVSYFDSFALSRALPTSIRYKLAYAAAQDVLYEEYKHFAPLGELLFNTFPFPRRDQDNIKQGLDATGKLLDQGYSVVMFPEGKISKDGTLQPLKLGAGLAGIEMNVAIVPVKLEGTNTIFPYDRMLPQARGKVKVTFGNPLRFSKKTSYNQATKEIEQALKKL